MMDQEIEVYSDGGVLLGTVKGPGFSVSRYSVLMELHDENGTVRDYMIIGRPAPQPVEAQ